MGIFDKLKTVLNEVAPVEAGKIAEPVKTVKPKRTPKPKADAVEDKPKKAPAKSKKKVAEDPEKIRATKRGEPWVKILSMDLDPSDPGQGSFELDWNDKFVSNLVRAGYQGKTDADIVDNWFQTICRNVALETWAQEQADPSRRQEYSNKKDLGNGRTEIS